MVEDSEDDALLVLRELRRGGIDLEWRRVQTAEDMAAALDSQAWDLVISDHSMPAFSSSAALELLRERGLDLPFVIVSGQIGEDVAVAAMRAGAHDYIMKDNMARLNTAVERELREAEVRRERRRAEEKYRSIFENAVEGIFQTTVDGDLVTANPALARMLGYGSPEELLAAVSDVGDQLYVEPERRAEFGRLVQENGEVSGFEIQMYRKDGKTVWISLTARVVFDETGAHVGYEGTAEDITERRRSEETLRAFRETERRRIARDLHDEALQDLTYALQSLQLAHYAAGSEDKNEERSHQIEALRRAVGGLREAIYDLRLNAGRDHDLVSSLMALVALNKTMAPMRELELKVEDSFPRTLPGATATEMLRIVKEGLANVRRHSGATRATISLRREEGMLEAEIEDDGHGFDATVPAGAGLTGMAERVQMIGGRLVIESEPGSGTRVRLWVQDPR
jgi:two-component system, NarL family, sensor histidine kinase UhpB